MARGSERPCFLRPKIDRPAFDADFSRRKVGCADGLHKASAVNVWVVPSIAQIGPRDPRSEDCDRFEVARAVLGSDHNAIGRAISFRQPSPASEAEGTTALQFGQLDLAVAAIRRRRRLFNGGSQRVVHKWEPQDSFLRK